MSDIYDQSSDTSSDLNWPIDHPIEGQQQDRVVFEAVADQYVKGENVTAFFTILQDIKINTDEDRIGLLRVGSTKIQECLAYAAVQFSPSTSSGSVRHGTATFPSSLLPVTDDEFYQFCYIFNKTKNLGSSIPFQLNCELDDIDLLTNNPVGKSKPDGLIALADNDNDDLIVIHTKRVLTEEKLRQENQQLIKINRQLELQKDECQVKLDSVDAKRREQINKLNTEMQAFIASHKTAADELSSRQQSETKLRTEYNTCRSLCDQYQNEASEYAERCRMLETAQAHILNDANQTRAQLAVTSQLTKDQATQVIDLERRLMQSNELSKTANQRQALLEQQLRDLRLTSEKHQLSMQGQLDEHSKQAIQREDRIIELEAINNLLKDELNSLKADNEHLSSIAKQDKDLAEQLQQSKKQNQEKNEMAQNEIESLRNELNGKNIDQQAYMALKTSFIEIEKRCVKHQKTEIEVKRQLAGYQSFINDLQREIQDLTERLSAGADEYKVLFRKHTALEHSIQQQQQQQEEKVEPIEAAASLNEEDLVSVLRNTYENQQETQISSARASLANIDEEVRKCPMCYWEFPKNLNTDGKREHIEQHFE